MGYEFDGVVYERLRDMQAARRARYVQLLESGMNFTQAALAVDVSKRTGKVWRNGRTRSSGRDERPLVDWYAGRMKANSGHSPQAGTQPLDHQPRTAAQRVPGRWRIPAPARPPARQRTQGTSQGTQNPQGHQALRLRGRRPQAALESRADRPAHAPRLPR